MVWTSESCLPLPTLVGSRSISAGRGEQYARLWLTSDGTWSWASSSRIPWREAPSTDTDRGRSPPRVGYQETILAPLTRPSHAGTRANRQSEPVMDAIQQRSKLGSQVPRPADGRA